VDLMLERALGQQFIVRFVGKQEPSTEIRDTLARQHLGGVELFSKNIGTPAELLGLTTALQKLAASTGQPPLLIAINQEAGLFMALRDGTPFPTQMAMGATRSEELTTRVGAAIGRELAAVGANVNFAPVADVNNNPGNSVIGTRSFGDDPQLVARMTAAMVKGLQSAGIAATAKHFPGHGDTTKDSRYGTPTLPHGLDRLQRIELPPFEAAIAAGVHLIMTAHIVLPRLTDGEDLPATVSPAILTGLLRRKLGFKGLIITDSMDMKAMDQGAGLVVDVMAALGAGADLLLFSHSLARQADIFAALVHAARRGLLNASAAKESAARILALKEWLKSKKAPPLSVVGCAEHQELAREIAFRSMTLVRDASRKLPLRLAPDARIAVAVVQAEDRRAAGPSHMVPQLAAAVRRHHPRVDELSFPMDLSEAEAASLRDRLAGYDLALVGTMGATNQAGQAALVNGLVAKGVFTVVVGMGLPYDVIAFPAAPVFACAYGVLPPSMDAMADALFGRAPFHGQLPVAIPKPRTQSA
jgi:beta-N-acetylhexosaminidase